MTTYHTRNPLGSTAVKDLYDNAENLDHRENDRENEEWGDRFGVPRLTWHGIEKRHERQQQEFEDQFEQFLLSSGYEDLGDYGPGLHLTSRNQIFRYNGELYRPSAVLDLPYTTTGVWADESGLFVSVGDAALRQELAAPTGAELVDFKQPGVGARQRTVADKFRETISAFDYVSPSWTPSQQREGFQRMIDSAGPAAVFVIPSIGSSYFQIDDTLYFDDYQTFRGDSQVQIVMVGGAKACFAPRKTGARTEFVEFSSLTLRNSNTNLWVDENAIGINVLEVSHFKLVRCRLRDFSRALIHGGTTPGVSGGYYNSIEECEIANNKVGIDAIDNANSTVVIGGRIHSNREGFRGANLTDYTFLAAFERNRIGIHCLSGAQGVNAPSGRFEGNNRNQVITNIVVAAGVATVNSARHWLVDGDEVIVTVSAEPLLNGIKTVSAAGPNSYQLDATGVADGTYSGTGATIVLPAGGAAVYEVGAFRNSIGGCHFSSGADQVIDKDGRNFFISSGGGTRPTSGLSSNNIAGNPKFRVDSNADGLADGWSVESAPPSAGFTLALDTSVKRGGVNSQRLTVASSGTVRKSVFRRFRVTPGIPWILVIDFRTDTALPWNLRIGNALNGTDYVNTPLSYKGDFFSQVPTYFVPTQEDIVVTLFMNASTASAGSASKNLWIDSISLSPGTVAPMGGVEARATMSSYPSSGRPTLPEPLEIVFDSTLGMPIFYDGVAGAWKSFDGVVR